MREQKKVPGEIIARILAYDRVCFMGSEDKDSFSASLRPRQMMTNQRQYNAISAARQYRQRTLPGCYTIL